MRASCPIYEGTNGIQAIDLVTRKLPLVRRRDRCAHSIAAMRATVTRLVKEATPAFGHTGARLRECDREPRSGDELPASRPCRETRPTTHSPAQRPICASSAWRRAARSRRHGACGERGRSRAGDTDPAIPGASRSAASSPRTSPPLRAASRRAFIAGASFVQDAPLGARELILCRLAARRSSSPAPRAASASRSACARRATAPTSPSRQRPPSRTRSSGHDLHRGRRDRGGRRQGAAARLSTCATRRRCKDAVDKTAASLRRARHRREQCQRDQPDADTRRPT